MLAQKPQKDGRIAQFVIGNDDLRHPGQQRAKDFPDRIHKGQSGFLAHHIGGREGKFPPHPGKAIDRGPMRAHHAFGFSGRSRCIDDIGDLCWHSISDRGPNGDLMAAARFRHNRVGKTKTVGQFQGGQHKPGSAIRHDMAQPIRRV